MRCTRWPRQRRVSSPSPRSARATRGATSGWRPSPTAIPARRRTSRHCGSTATSMRSRCRPRPRASTCSIISIGGYGRDDDVTRALDTRAFYICPRISPDGAEWALAEQPRFVRSSTRSYPFAEPRIEGFEARRCRWRRPRAAHAHQGSARPLEGLGQGSATAGEARSGGGRRHLLPRAARGRLRRRRATPMRAASGSGASTTSTSTATSPATAGGRSSSSAAPAISRPASRKCAPSCSSSSTIPTSPAA